MNPKKGTPGKGGGQRTDSFSYCPVAHGLKNAFAGWLAGEPYWADVAHEHSDKDHGTKPCLNWLTDGALRCVRCARLRPVKCIGWVPLYREMDSRPVFVIVHESASDLLHSLSFPVRVLVGRIGPKDSVFVRRADTQEPMRSDKPCRQGPIDITRDLLSVWNMPEYVEWLKCRPAPAIATPAKPVSEPLKSDGKPFSPGYRAAAVKAEGFAEETVEDAMQRALRRAKQREAKPSTNGSAKHVEGE